MFKAYYRINTNHGLHPRGLFMANTTPEGMLTFGWALTNNLDIYNKQLANTIASGRLNSEKFQCDLFDDAALDSLLTQGALKRTEKATRNNVISLFDEDLPENIECPFSFHDFIWDCVIHMRENHEKYHTNNKDASIAV